MGEARERTSDDAGSTAALTRAIMLVGRVVAPTSLVAALLVYYGWVRTTTFYESFGIHYSVLELTSQDYVLSSVGVAINSLKWMLIALLAIVLAHLGVACFLRWKERWRAGLVPLMFAAGVYLLCISYLHMTLDGVARNLAWTAGIGLTGYSLWLAGSLPVRWGWSTTFATRAAERWPAFGSLSRFLIVGLIVVGLFVTVAWHAEAEGRESAGRTIKCPKLRPAATVYSRDPLTMEATGVSSAVVSDDAEAYRYRYTGLRFLVRSGEKYFLLPEAMSPTAPQAVILPDSASIRIELGPGSRCEEP